MPDLAHILAAVVPAAAVWTLFGLPLALRTLPRPLAWFAAPQLGWAVHAALALPLFSLIGMSPATVMGSTVVFAATAAVALWHRRGSLGRVRFAPLIIVAAAAVLAGAVMAGVLPKTTAAGIVLSSPIFDHSKIALVDEIMRSGVPPTNPFYGEAGLPQGIAYYYLWHFSAAVVGVAADLTGWEADAGLTWFTAFASLLLVMGLAVTIGGRSLAAALVVGLAATGSARIVLAWLFGTNNAEAVVGEATGFGGWLFQVSWAPQHVAAGACVVLACVLLAAMRHDRGPLLPLVLAALAAAGLQSSLWVGGVTFGLAAVAIGLAGLASPGDGRGRFVVASSVAAGLAVLLAAPLLAEQIAVAPLRGGGVPIAVRPVDALGDAFPRLLDLPGYWLVYLPVEFPAFYLAGLSALACGWNAWRQSAAPLLSALSVLLVASLTAAWLLASTVGVNNDLGWRAVLPAVMVLIALAAAGIARAISARRPLAVALAAAGVALGLPDAAATIRENVVGGAPSNSAAAFAESPALWTAVRRHVAAAERVAVDPRLFADMTPWPVNMSWALFADRRSCYASAELAVAFAPLSAERRRDTDALFARVFDGAPAPGDVARLAGRLRCDVLVVTPHEDAWARDPFAAGAAGTTYRLIEDAPGWRIYRRVEGG